MAKIPKKKKTILLCRNDGRLMETKMSISKLIEGNHLHRVKWVLIPIYRCAQTYISVEGTQFLDRQISSARVRFHLIFREINPHSGIPSNDLPKYDYYPTSIDVYSYEDLYQLIYQIGVFRYIQELYGYGDGKDPFWYMTVEDIEITLYNNSQQVDHFTYRQHSEKDIDVPFQYSSFGDLCKALFKHFGIADANEEMVFHNMAIERASKKSDQNLWRISKGPIQLFDKVRMIGIGNPKTKSYTFLTMDVYDQILRLKNAQVFLTPLGFAHCKPQSIVEYLSTAHKYELPKYEFTSMAQDDYANNRVYHDLSNYITEVFSIMVYDAEDVVLLIENLSFLMQIYYEGAKIENAIVEETDDLNSMMYKATVFCEIVVDTETDNGVPSDESLHITTDFFEDDLPKVTEIGLILYTGSKFMPF